MGQDNCKPQTGDLIEIDRRRHQHWALYVGDGYVINLIPVGKQDLKLGDYKMPVFIRKVKKQRLKEVVQKKKWRVNNECDQYHTPLPVKEIIQCAEHYIDKELTYREFGSNCEHFVKKLRYGGQLKAFVAGELPILGMTEDTDYPNPGDLIEIKRGHWALYLGKGYVIHVTDTDERAPSLSASRKSILTRKARVTKELLEKVAVNDDWAVNNNYDHFRTPLPVEEIIWRAEGCIGKELPCDVLSTGSEDFVTQLRYGGQLKAFVAGELPILGMTEDTDYPNPGDLIEIKRGLYTHWALYLGKGYVIHVTDTDEGAPALSVSSRTILSRKAKVKKELLKDVVGYDEWCVNNKYDCQRIPFPMAEIIRRAEHQIDKEVPYRLFLKNCEHFVTRLRYGEGVSAQAKKALQNINSISSAVSAGIGAASLIAVASIPVFGLPLMACVPFVAAGGGGLLASIGFTSSNIAHSFTSAKFEKAGKDILEQSCC
ncbi:uncharacterized protein LOC128811980 isoform X1 [Vidua macroura]|uniref:uncharacterized protein LOC128811980 isoform X1 n=2 Tax=Vidua macroura TaxID=187451 RepID=UPI0023A8A143|nr:uncharacterized protein LOC128811980 isoform X1 [Vidua macroura]XP_053842014.1 uncharacterized protein LOC128811980 isoform X1 [Vidua macroura]